MPPRGPCRAACELTRPCLFTQYATVDGGRPSSRASDSIDRPATNCDSSHSRSMEAIGPRSGSSPPSGELVADQVEDALALDGQLVHVLGALARPGGGDAAVEAMQVELQALELERRGRRVELSRADDQLGDQAREVLVARGQ